jgi:hypothetical protein
MRELWQLLTQNPILLVIVAAWIAGAIGNAAKTAKQARERAARRTSPPPPQPEAARRREPVRPGPTRPAQRSPDEVAAEMRRILGMDVETVPVAPEKSPLVVRPKRREVVEPERPPAPALPTTQARRLEVHVDPHVGESMQRRHSPQTGKVGAREAGSTFGTLGGRVHGARRGRGAGSSLVNLTDLKRAFVTSEILGAPLSLRGPNEIRGA